MGTPLDDDIEWMEKYGKDYEYFHANHKDLYSKHKNEFVAVKNLKVYHDTNPLKLKEQLMADGVVDVDHAFIEFMGDVSGNIR